METTPQASNFKHRQLFILFSVIGLTLLVGFLPASWFGIQPFQPSYTKINLTEATLRDVIPDTDTDGTISWKEFVLANAGDETLPQGTPDPKVIADLNDPNNLTASFSQNLYVTSSYLAKNNLNNAQAEQEVINRLIEEEAIKLQPTIYGLKDIITTEPETKAAMKKYGNAVAPILNSIINEASITDIFFGIQAFTETNDPEAITLIEKELVKIDAGLKKLLTLPIPLSAATYHLSAVNRVAEYRDLVSNLSKAASDPLRASISVGSYPDTTVQTLRIYDNLAGYFDVQGVVFSSQEPGYVFTVGYTLK